MASHVASIPPFPLLRDDQPDPAIYAELVVERGFDPLRRSRHEAPGRWQRDERGRFIKRS